MKIAIYKLTDPITNEIRYIGKTSRTLDIRLSGHISTSRSESKLFKSKKSLWILELAKNNLKPLISRIEDCDEVDADKREEFWIKFFEDQFKLFNIEYTKGFYNAGRFKDGIKPWNHYDNNPEYSNESKLKMSQSAKDRALTDEGKSHHSNAGKANLGVRKSDTSKMNKASLKKVLQYNLRGVFIREFKSVTEAAENANTSTSLISRSCKGISKASKGSVYRYKTLNDYPVRINPGIPDYTLKRMLTIHGQQ